MDASKRNIETFRKLQAGMQSGKFDNIESILAPEFEAIRSGIQDVFALAQASVPETGNVYVDVPAGGAVMREWFGEQNRVIEEIVGVDNMVFTKFRVEAKHTGEVLGCKPTGKPITIAEAAVLWFDDEGRITKSWFIGDELNILLQLGLIEAKGLVDREYA